jgi:hypothetical protein
LEHNYYANYFFVEVVERGLVIGISRSEGLDMRVYWGNRRNSFEEWRVYICVNPVSKSRPGAPGYPFNHLIRCARIAESSECIE